MDLLPHASDDVFSVRFYDGANGPAEEQYHDMRDFEGCCLVVLIDEQTAVVKLALSRARATRRAILALCTTLKQRGIRAALISRSGWHGAVPYATEITHGLLAGKLWWDIPAILGGQDGDY